MGLRRWGTRWANYDEMTHILDDCVAFREISVAMLRSNESSTWSFKIECDAKTVVEMNGNLYGTYVLYNEQLRHSIPR